MRVNPLSENKVLSFEASTDTIDGAGMFYSALELRAM